MVLDNSELMPTGADWPSGENVMKVAGAIGGGVGASLAISSGTVTGAALVGVLAAAGLGVGGAIVAGTTVGNLIGETDLVKENLLKLMEAICPIDSELPQPTINEPAAPGEKFSVSFGTESFEFDFYVESMGVEGFSLDSNFNAGVDLYSNPFDAAAAAMELQIIGTDDYYTNGCNGNPPAFLP